VPLPVTEGVTVAEPEALGKTLGVALPVALPCTAIPLNTALPSPSVGATASVSGCRESHGSAARASVVESSTEVARNVSGSTWNSDSPAPHASEELHSRARTAGAPAQPLDSEALRAMTSGAAALGWR
jgi:hypothetical protein